MDVVILVVNENSFTLCKFVLASLTELWCQSAIINKNKLIQSKRKEKQRDRDREREGKKTER